MPPPMQRYHTNAPTLPEPFASDTGTRTRVARVRAEYPNQLDYSGSVRPCAATAWNAPGSAGAGPAPAGRSQAGPDQPGPAPIGRGRAWPASAGLGRPRRRPGRREPGRSWPGRAGTERPRPGRSEPGRSRLGRAGPGRGDPGLGSRFGGWPDPKPPWTKGEPSGPVVFTRP